MTDGSGSTTYQYDAHGNVIERTITVGGITGSVGFAYDEADRLTQIAYPSGRSVDYMRDVLGQVTAIRLTHSDGITTETVVSGIAYAPFGPMTSLMFGNGITLSRDHDLDYRLTSQAAGGVQNVSLSYDGNGNLTALTDAIDGSRSQTLGYDALDRLTSAGGGYGSRNWSYDAVGNRLSSTGGGSETYSYAADSNRLIEYTTGSSYTVSYDANGNITGDGYYGFSYGDHNRLTEARVLGSPVATYTYNGLGQRVTKDNGAVTHFVYDQAGRLLGEYDGTGATRKEVIRLNGVPVAVFAGGAVSYVHSDQLGTPRLITDGTGTVRWRWDSAPFGDTQADGDPDGDGSYAEFNLRFPGQYYDSETGLHYNYFRDYVPGFGRYLESDPIGLDGGLNTYAYVSANPLSSVDPLGLVEWNGYMVYEGIGAGITTNFYNWYLESKCFEGEKLQVLIRGESDFFSSLSVGASSTKGKTTITLYDPWAAPAASNLSRTGANSFVVESLGLGWVGTSNVTVGDATTDGWDRGTIRGGLDFSFGRIAGETEILKEEWTSCGCEE